jgi:hypothetical protein
MPKIRIGLSTDFNLVGEQVGIGTTNPTARLDVAGQILADNTAGSGGVSTFREYQGFHQTQSNVSHKVTIDATTAGNLNSLSGELRIDGDVTIAPDTSVTSGKIDSLTATDKFAVPLGDTNSRDNTPEAGTTRFNQDFGTLEFFDGVNWKTVNSYSRGGAAGRGVFMGGFDLSLNPNPAFTTEISYINISSLGNTQSFGDVTPNMGGGCAGLGNATRGLVAGGFAPSYHDVIEYITIAAGGNSIDFGNLTDARRYASGASSSTRGVFAGGYSPGVVNVIDYVEITTVGNALDFGDLSEHGEAMGTATSPTRACFAGGRHPQTDEFIDYITMASTGDAIDFGDLSQARQNMCYHTSSSSTRGIFAGGIIPATVDTIDSITIASVGNATDFGNLTEGRRLAFNVSTQTRAVFAGGYNNVQSMDYITIASAANAIDFGEMVGKRRFSGGACSDSHGGLGGF